MAEAGFEGLGEWGGGNEGDKEVDGATCEGAMTAWGCQLSAWETNSGCSTSMDLMAAGVRVREIRPDKGRWLRLMNWSRRGTT